MFLRPKHRPPLITVSRPVDLLNMPMIVPVDEISISAAAAIHSETWKASHRAFCSEAFIEAHTPERQKQYLLDKLKNGSRIYMLIDDEPVGIVSITGSLIEDLYVLPRFQRRGYGRELLGFAVEKCAGTPTLWILEHNLPAEALYTGAGFKKTGRVNSAGRIAEIEYSL